MADAGQGFLDTVKALPAGSYDAFVGEALNPSYGTIDALMAMTGSELRIDAEGANRLYQQDPEVAYGALPLRLTNLGRVPNGTLVELRRDNYSPEEAQTLVDTLNARYGVGAARFATNDDLTDGVLSRDHYSLVVDDRALMQVHYGTMLESGNRLMAAHPAWQEAIANGVDAHSREKLNRLARDEGYTISVKDFGTYQLIRFNPPADADLNAFRPALVVVPSSHGLTAALSPALQDEIRQAALGITNPGDARSIAAPPRGRDGAALG